MPELKQQEANVPARLKPEALISFVSGTTTNIGKGTFYNMASEQRKAMENQHLAIMAASRPFYALMTLPQGTNDTNKQMIAWNLIKNTIREKNLEQHEKSPTTMWENAIIVQALLDAPVTRVFDLFEMLATAKISKKRAAYLVWDYLRANKQSWPLWAIKYRDQFAKIIRHFHMHNGTLVKVADKQLHKIYRYLFYGEPTKDDVIADYEAVRNKKLAKKTRLEHLVKLPETVARGFQKEFGLTDDEFLKFFIKKGGQLTAKEKRVLSKGAEEAGVKTGLDLRRLGLMDLLLHAYNNKIEGKKIEKLVSEKAAEIAKHLHFKFGKVGIVLDTTKSMYGTKDQAYHPMLRGLATAAVLKEVSEEANVYRTNPGDEFFPVLRDQSNYADAIMKALKDKCDTVIIVGDGYENAPAEGAAHQLIFLYKQKVDKKNKTLFLHFNPVFSAEVHDVRNLTDLAPATGLSRVEALDSALFLGLAKTNPEIAMQKYIGYLAGLQSDRATELMPKDVKKLITAKEVKLL